MGGGGGGVEFDESRATIEVIKGCHFFWRSYFLNDEVSLTHLDPTSSKFAPFLILREKKTNVFVCLGRGFVHRIALSSLLKTNTPFLGGGGILLLVIFIVQSSSSEGEY